MPTDVRNVALVTGASSGIGRACAIHLSRQGYYVVGTTRRSPADVKADLRASLSSDDRLEVVSLDVNDCESVRSVMTHIEDTVGRLDVVVHCAGYGIAGAVEDTSDEEARAILETNLLGTLRVCRAALPTMRAQGKGTLVILSSIGGRIGLPFQGLYSVTKFALEGLVEALRMEARGFGVRAVLIEPGDFCTGFTDARQIVFPSENRDVYRDARNHVLSIVEKDERGGGSPEIIARLIGRILRKRNPRVRYTVGPVAQKLAAGLKRCLPSKLFEWAIATYYGVT